MQFSRVEPRSQLALSFLFICCSIKPALAHDHFNPLSLENDEPGVENVDLSVFEKGGQAEGTYNVDIYINNTSIETKNIAFKNKKSADNKLSLQPCLSVEQLKQWGVKTENFPELKNAPNGCTDLSLLAGAVAKFNVIGNRLDLAIPQIALIADPREFVPTSEWDEGINAFLLNYSFTGSQDHDIDENRTENSEYANLRPGINIGAWRFRNYSTWNHDSDGQNSWDSAYTYVSRDIEFLKGQLIAGENNTPADVFDSISFKGVQISSDDDMLPDSMKGFAPVIRGVAKSSAQVTVEQNGYTIYKTNVPAGPFAINDLYPTGGSGDLYVTIKESDGSEQHFIVPYASVPVLQREGHLKYDLTVGRTRSSDTHSAQQNFAELTALYGLAGGITAYGGIESTLSNDVYHAALIGTGLYLGDLGALSLDVTNSWSKIKAGDVVSDTLTGQSWRIRYSKDIQSTGTNFTVAGYRYSTKDYYALEDVLDTYSDNSHYDHVRNRTDLSLSQDIIYGSISLTLYNEDYWNDTHTTSLGIGYNNTWHNVSYGINYSYTLNADNSQDEDDDTEDSNDQQISINISIPLDAFMPSTYATYNMNSAKDGDTTHTVGLNGTALAQKNLSWSVQEGYSSQEKATSGNVSATYNGTYADINGGYSYDNHMRRLNYGVQGGVLLHRNGLTLSQPMDDTIILVKAPGAAGVPVNNETGVDTDFRGYAVVPYASPYHRNEVSLDTTGIRKNIELIDTSKTLVPTRGAVVRAEYKTNIGYKALMVLTRINNLPVPFGATVSSLTKPDNHSSFVGDAGQAWLTGLEKQGRLLVKWGPTAADQCQVSYRIPSSPSASGVEILHEQCQ
ncbi:fimbrial outer membrane usher protein [Salmonella enterica]|nr:fimbrial outer membrane usher protein [Salmonella enterica]